MRSRGEKAPELAQMVTLLPGHTGDSVPKGAHLGHPHNLGLKGGEVRSTRIS